MSRSAHEQRTLPQAGTLANDPPRRSLFVRTCERVRRRLVTGIGIGLVLLGVSGCMGPVAKAPFAQRLGSGQAGSLTGPFDGVVMDQSTGNPLASALVVGTWAFQDTGGLGVPESSHTVSVVTGSDGTYSLPSVPAGRQFAGLLRRFTLVVYKAGFVGYRSDLRFEDRSPRHNFVQHGNVVRLDRFPASESHVRHLVFLGSGAALRGAAQAEIIAASLELQDAAPKLASDEGAQAGSAPAPSATGESAEKEGS